jgi:hypothetical protein
MNWEATAKNIIAVGATRKINGGYGNRFDVNIAGFSSRGPCDDGRIKPDLVAPGVGILSVGSSTDENYYVTQGTSMSAPHVTGLIGLIQQYALENYGDYVTSSMVKAILIQSAYECGLFPGPDYIFGWGMVNAVGAIDLMAYSNDLPGYEMFSETLNEGESFTLDFSADPSKPIKATLVWTDPAGTPPPSSLDPTTPMLVNNLDLRISQGETEFLPWLLDKDNPGAFDGSRETAAGVGDNNVDNVEQVFIGAPDGGEYTLTISHKGSLTPGFQQFSLILEYGALSNLADYRLDREFEVFPSIASDVVNIRRKDGQPFDLINLQVTDARGRVLSNGLNFTNQIDVANLPSGAYWLIFRTEEGTAQKAFIKQ